MIRKNKILTLHPTEKKGVNIDREKYELVKTYILNEVTNHPEIKFSDLVELGKKRLNGQFDGQVTWYIVTVKLDLQARGLIERFKKSGVQWLRLRNKAGQL